MDLTTLGAWVSIVLIAATVTTGLLAGLYFAFSCAVMPGLAVTSDTTLVESMQRINEKIINGWFIPVFVGGVVLPITAAIMVAVDGETDVLLWTLAAAVLAVVGFVITASRNVPLNNQLDKAGPIEAMDDARTVRMAFEGPWTRWNTYRTIVTTLVSAGFSPAVPKGPLALPPNSPSHHAVPSGQGGFTSTQNRACPIPCFSTVTRTPSRCSNSRFCT